MAITQWIVELLDKVSAPAKAMQLNIEGVRASVDGSSKALEEINNNGKKLVDINSKINAVNINAMNQSVQGLVSSLRAVNQPGADFEYSLAEVEAITGVTGKALQDLGKTARQSALEFGGKATDSLDTYKTILSRLGPDIGKNKDALNLMERNARILSKTMGGDLGRATDALTTSMLQMGVDLTDPMEAAKEMEKIMHVMAAGAKEGAAEVPGISDALKVSGVQAKRSGLEFYEVSNALQALAQGGLEGSEAGTKFRNVMSKMSAVDILPAEVQKRLKGVGVDMNKLSDETVPFTERLRELKKIQNDKSLVDLMFGEQNSAAASVLLDRIDMQEELNAKTKDTVTALEQAGVLSDTYNNKMAKFKAWIDDIKISFFGVTKHITPFAEGLGTVISVGADMTNAYKGVSMVMESDFIKSLKGVTLAQLKLNLAFLASPLVWVPALLLAVAGGLYLLWQRSEKFRMVVTGLWESLKSFGSAMKEYVIDRIKTTLSGISGIGQALMHFFKGDWKKAWEVGKDAVADLSGVNSAKKLKDNLKENLPKAYQEGQEKALAAINQKKLKESGESKNTKKKPTTNSTMVDDVLAKTEPRNPSTGATIKAENNNTLEGSGSSGAGKIITMNCNIVNNFNVDKHTNIDYIAEKVIGKVNDRLRDAMAAV